MTETEILRQIVQKQDELIIIDDNIITVNSSLRYVDSFSTQEIKLENERDFLYEKYRDIKKELAELRQQLEKFKETKLSLPLDVPTDKEIEGEAMSYSSYPAMPDGHPEFNIIQANDFDAGAKWAIKQIIERNQK